MCWLYVTKFPALTVKGPIPLLIMFLLMYLKNVLGLLLQMATIFSSYLRFPWLTNLELFAWLHDSLSFGGEVCALFRLNSSFVSCRVCLISLVKRGGLLIMLCRFSQTGRSYFVECTLFLKFSRSSLTIIFLDNSMSVNICLLWNLLLKSGTSILCSVALEWLLVSTSTNLWSQDPRCLPTATWLMRLSRVTITRSRVLLCLSGSVNIWLRCLSS